MTKTNRDLVVDNLLAFDRLAYREIADDYAEDAILRRFGSKVLGRARALLARNARDTGSMKGREQLDDDQSPR